MELMARVAVANSGDLPPPHRADLFEAAATVLPAEAAALRETAALIRDCEARQMALAIEIKPVFPAR